MKVGIDTNVLIVAALPELHGHVEVKRVLSDLLRAEATLALTPAILHELIHVITDPKRFERPLSMVEASALARYYLNRSNVELLTTDESAVLLAVDLLEKHRLGRKRLADTLFAATLLTHEVARLVTLNSRDFRLFTDLELIDPLAQ